MREGTSIINGGPDGAHEDGRGARSVAAQSAVPTVPGAPFAAPYSQAKRQADCGCNDPLELAELRCADLEARLAENLGVMRAAYRLLGDGHSYNGVARTATRRRIVDAHVAAGVDFPMGRS